MEDIIVYLLAVLSPIFLIIVLYLMKTLNNKKSFLNRLFKSLKSQHKENLRLKKTIKLLKGQKLELINKFEDINKQINNLKKL